MTPPNMKMSSGQGSRLEADSVTCEEGFRMRQERAVYIPKTETEAKFWRSTKGTDPIKEHL